ncbi:TnsA-like heteromeric transposase endonuclease subunit [Streptomyces sp. TRM43335]|uniref:TnsA-like heteromeric transposase endonuclease subunit n=1 Tax=Streptomyces taklimakanensis TaxID=2569853 RepID=A0A6G2BD86_9ACTN|nr:TnsA-like heteromeric transposase endonuclease subunit [Streptomyces taklimakanensis]MTE20023.1 TnsA-like heteromeric transposase endonuclease subunit [Streptomyces taklimakanensis]
MGTAVSAPVRLGVRRGDEAVVEDLEWPSVSLGPLREARPWRAFRWHKEQQHHWGAYWSVTMGDHVICESRLELGRLLFADFAPEVRHIVAQPFLPEVDIDGKVRKHIPDYLLLTDEGPLVVDVKPQHRLHKPEVALTFAWTREAVTSRGWQYEVWSEPIPIVPADR